MYLKLFFLKTRLKTQNTKQMKSKNGLNKKPPVANGRRNIVPPKGIP
jgi:hypothetical protein